MKRAAPEPLLPLRTAKQARNTIHNSSPAHPDTDPGILAKWMSLGQQTWNLGCETLQFLVDAPSKKSSILPLYTSHQQPHMHQPHILIPHNVPLPPSPSSNTTSPTEDASAYENHTSLQSSTSTSNTGASTGSAMDGPPARVQQALAASAREKRQMDELTMGTQRSYPSRPHIFADTHKAQLQANRQKEKNELVREIYKEKRRSGYGQSFAEFEDFIDYASRLEMMERKEMFSPSPSPTDLRSSKSAKSRRHTYTHDNNEFLERALAKARETLNEPQPPKPFLPSYEQLKLASRAKDEEIERRLRNPLPDSLPPQDEQNVDLILSKRGIISKFAREQVTNEDLSRLKPRQWLNDEIINFYGAMILGRSEGTKENPATGSKSKSKKEPLNVHYFSTFFWTKLKTEGYEKGRLAKWTKKIDLLSKDIVLIPINHDSTHWTSAAINFRQKRIESYDSMGMQRKMVYKLLREYLDAEHRNKRKGKPFDFTGWQDYIMEDTPQQENGYDCGVFTCQFLEALSRGEETFNFSQKNMSYLRRRMVWEIGNAKLRDEA